MGDLTIRPLGDHGYEVRVVDGPEETRHEVQVPPGFGAAVGVPDADEESLVRVSFEFLLEREPSSAVLSRFSLDDVARYFPEHHEELRARLDP